MKDKFNQKERQDIAYRIKWICKGCPEEVTYHDIKNNLNSNNDLLSYLQNKSNKDFLFEKEMLDQDLISILGEMTNITEDYYWRRIALFHGLIQFRQSKKGLNDNDIKERIMEIEYKEERNGMTQIFLNSLKEACSKQGDSDARQDIKRISEDREEGYEEDSLYNQFSILIDQSTVLTKASDLRSGVDKGGKREVSRLKALETLFEFDNYDFQDYEFGGGKTKFKKTKPMSLEKKNILKVLEDLKPLGLMESIEYFS